MSGYLKKRQRNDSADADLLRTAAGNPEAFAQFYDRYFDEILNYFCRRVSCPHQAADMTAETFAKALLTCKRYNSEYGNAAAWLYGIARHELIGTFRKTRRRDNAMKKLGIPPIPVDDHAIERIEAMIDASAATVEIRKAMAGLPYPVAKAISLRMTHELSFEEIGNRLGCTPAAARVRVTRGLSKIAKAVNA